MAYIHMIKSYDMENTGTQGASVSIFFNHCPHHCKNCWNESTWARDEALFIPNKVVIDNLIKIFTADFPIKTLALLGGDPLSPYNINDCIEIVSAIKEKFPDLEIICWTGFLWEAVKRSSILSPILPYLDILIDGRFIEARKVEGKHFGSDNQRCIDVQRSLAENKPIIHKYFWKEYE